MSTRRIGDLGWFDGDAVGALVAQLPGATRLSHVRRRQAPGGAAARQVGRCGGIWRQQHDAYFAPNNGPYAYNPNYMAPNGSMVDLGCWCRGSRSHGALHRDYSRRGSDKQYLVETEIDRIVAVTTRPEHLDYLRQEDCYVVLAFATSADRNNSSRSCAQLLPRARPTRP